MLAENYDRVEWAGLTDWVCRIAWNRLLRSQSVIDIDDDHGLRGSWRWRWLLLLLLAFRLLVPRVFQSAVI